MAGRAGRERSRVSIVDVARLAGVSPATAGRVLGGYGYASEANADRVRSAAGALGYRPNLLARGLITGRTQTIGIVASDIASPFYASVIRGIADTAQERGFGVIVTNSDERLQLEQEAVRLLLEKQVDGLIVAPSTPHESQHLAAAVESGCPVVQIDRVVRELPADSVTVDNVGAARACVRALTAAGHRRIGFVAELPFHGEEDLGRLLRPRARLPRGPGTMPSWQRLSGYLLALRDAGIAPELGLIRRLGVYSAAAAKTAVMELLTAHSPPTALFTVDGVMSTGAMEAIVALGLTIPGDLSLVCFDDLDWMQFVGGGITAASQPARTIGNEAANLLLRRIEGGGEPPHHLVIQVSLNLRASVRAPLLRTEVRT
jgi:LacI family transcriptional regulator